MNDRQRVVLSPCVLAKAFVDSDCRAVLEQWRDGAFQLAVTYPLLGRYLKLLRALGLSGKALRFWLLCFTSPEKAIFFPESAEGQGTAAEMLADAAQRGGASVIVYAAAPREGGRDGQVSATAFLGGPADP